MSSNIENLLSDYADLEPFAAQLNRHPRTVRRWMQAPDGLPFVRVGNRILIHLPTASEWILSRMRRPNSQYMSITVRAGGSHLRRCRRDGMAHHEETRRDDEARRASGSVFCG